ncbi:MAG TPA: hypothetical protein VKQ27_19025 [Acetobacteraceae bacterium]|nr:hypothetical protein [Acetobacteraceae bacterium]
MLGGALDPDEEQARTLALAWHLSAEPVVATALHENHREMLAMLQRAVRNRLVSRDDGDQVTLDVVSFEPALQAAYRLACDDDEVRRIVESAHEARKREEAGRQAAEKQRERVEAERLALLISDRAAMLYDLGVAWKEHRNPRRRTLAPLVIALAGALHDNTLYFRPSRADSASPRPLYAFAANEDVAWIVRQLLKDPVGRAALKVLSRIDLDLPRPDRRWRPVEPIELWLISVGRRGKGTGRGPDRGEGRGGRGD